MSTIAPRVTTRAHHYFFAQSLPVRARAILPICAKAMVALARAACHHILMKISEYRAQNKGNIRLWHLADIRRMPVNVRHRRRSGCSYWVQRRPFAFPKLKASASTGAAGAFCFAPYNPHCGCQRHVARDSGDNSGRGGRLKSLLSMALVRRDDQY
jgi:hypothetical protein